MANSSFDRLKELNLSRDEVNRLGQALRKDDFRKLLVSCVEEVQDPVNRQKYENEVKQFERERGQEVTFLHPTPGYVIKTSINGNQKGFINICSNDGISKPSSSLTIKDGAKGLQWSLPHSLSPPHNEIDNKGVECQVYDVLFHPDTLHLASKNQELRSMVNNVALTAIENNFDVVLDKKNLKFPNIMFKGMKRASLLRKPTEDKPQAEINDKIYTEIDSRRNQKSPTKKNTKTRRNSNEDNSVYTKPKYIIKHRSYVDMTDFTEHKNAKMNASIPKELIVEIDLPLLKSSANMDLDVTEKNVQLVSEEPAKYKLNLTLPHRVNDVSGSAKFDKDLRKLIISLPVKNQCAYEADSGVESCIEEIDLNGPNSPESANDELSDLKSFGSLHLNDTYSTPEFTCNIFNNIVAFTFHIKNVDESSVSKVACSKTSFVNVKFTSISSNYYPTCYAFCVKFPQHEIIEEDVNIETWDNNVILQIPLKASEKKFVSYLCGRSEYDLSEKCIEEPAVISKNLEVAEINEKIQAKQEKFTDTKLKSNAIDILATSYGSSGDELSASSLKNEKIQAKQEKFTDNKLKSSAIDILATSYGSSGDELSASSFSPRKSSKGILKRISNKRASFGRSVSESSLDDYLCSSYENYGFSNIECVPEESREGEDEELASSLKKTVRFNDVVSKQLFRSNSSILGQKKKNQRKARNKKRAHERRYSESEASDVDSKKEGDNQTNSETEKESKPEENVAVKKDDSDIFHLEINN
ncbi:unnamed protein product [Ceutorhynchus assimilis]|uniref:Protein kintoun n=1 Tax=Ceutorhynchus assimilis TaxID=467358 RepID=A0A9N9MIQ8_9CUCU|nr:unnamed protein product [Ceutorhynchus assimilis]